MPETRFREWSKGLVRCRRTTDNMVMLQISAPGVQGNGFMLTEEDVLDMMDILQAATSNWGAFEKRVFGIPWLGVPGRHEDFAEAIPEGVKVTPG